MIPDAECASLIPVHWHKKSRTFKYSLLLPTQEVMKWIQCLKSISVVCIITLESCRSFFFLSIFWVCPCCGFYFSQKYSFCKSRSHIDSSRQSPTVLS